MNRRFLFILINLLLIIISVGILFIADDSLNELIIPESIAKLEPNEGGLSLLLSPFYILLLIEFVLILCGIFILNRWLSAKVFENSKRASIWWTAVCGVLTFSYVLIRIFYS